MNVFQISDIAVVKTGGTPSRKEKDFYTNGNNLWVKTQELLDSKIWDTEEKITDLAIQKSNAKLLPENTILLAMYGATVGKLGILKSEATTNQACAGIICNKTKVNYLYLYYSLAVNRQRIISLAQGAAQQNINLSVVKNFQVTIPQLNIQYKIASILSSFDDLIENNNKRIKTLEKIANSIYKSYFLEDDNSFTEYKLSDLVSTQYGYTESAKNEVVGPHYLRGTDINKKSYIVWDEVPYCPISESDYKKYKLEIKDILIIRMADPGKIGIVEKEIDAVFASYLIRLRIVKNIISPYYLFYFLNSDKYQNYINGASNGTTRQSASAKVITDIKIPVPDIDLLNSFEEKVGKIRELISNLVDKNEMLTKAKNLLLPKLISGELDVEGLDIKIRPEIL